MVRWNAPETSPRLSQQQDWERLSRSRKRRFSAANRSCSLPTMPASVGEAIAKDVSRGYPGKQSWSCPTSWWNNGICLIISVFLRHFKPSLPEVFDDGEVMTRISSQLVSTKLPVQGQKEVVPKQIEIAEEGRNVNKALRRTFLKYKTTVNRYFQ